MDSVPPVVLAGALGTVAAVLLQLAGRWPGGRPAFGPFQSGLLALSLRLGWLGARRSARGRSR
jgi:hypothetical protein